MRLNDADGMANSVEPDQEQSDLGLHCLLRPVGPKRAMVKIGPVKITKFQSWKIIAVLHFLYV